MNRTVEKINAGHYLVLTEECGQYSISKHDGKWLLRRAGHLVDSYATQKEALREISEQQRIVRRQNYLASQAA